MGSGVAAALVGLALSGCAATAGGSSDDEAFDTVSDPLEPFNRTVFAFNEAVDAVVLRPVATVYDTVVPPPAQRGVTNFLRNLYMPLVFANQLLQGDWRGAEVAFNRFFLNTTLGLGGFIDIAAYDDLTYEPEDFGQTLAVWGVGEGPYLVLPIFGPSNPRDALGLVADTAADPFRIAAADGYNYARAGAVIVDERQQTLDTTEELKRGAVDYYATVRSLYRQYREAQIQDGAPAAGIPEIPDFDATMPFVEPDSPALR